MSLLRVEMESGIAWLTLNRPEQRNALDMDTFQCLDAVLAGLRDAPELRVVVLRGAGRGFAAGADLKAVTAGEPGATAARLDLVQAILGRVEAFPRPVVASIHGWALGAGLELALACHLRMASLDARLGMPECGLGLIPGYGGTQRLPRLLGASRALDMLLTGEPLSGEQALAWGLVTRAVPPEELDAETRRLARQLAGRGPLALSAILEAVRLGGSLELEEALAEERRLYLSLEHTRDRLEGLQAFREKRPPVFSGR
nr:enoyl-CoA hydratase-related protein [uncultured Holophaga sp.]